MPNRCVLVIEGDEVFAGLLRSSLLDYGAEVQAQRFPVDIVKPGGAFSAAP
jgi:hypothetical protein